MKNLLILIFLFTSVLLFGSEYPIMLQIQSKTEISEDLRDGIEEGLTQLKYSLIDEQTQKEALKEQANQRKSECFDESCLVDTGKMLAAKALIIVEVSKKDDSNYKFKARYVDFETGSTTRAKSLYFEGDIKDFKKLNSFGKKLIVELFEKSDKIEEKVIEKKVEEKIEENNETEIQKETDTKNVEETKQEEDEYKNEVVRESRGNFKEQSWTFGIGLSGGNTRYSLDFKSSVNNTIESDNATIDSFGLCLDFQLSYIINNSFYLFMDINGIFSKGDYTLIRKRTVSVFEANTLLGGQFNFNNDGGRNLMYYLKFGAGLGKIEAKEEDDGIIQISSMGLTGYLEGGINFYWGLQNTIDIFIGILYSKFITSSTDRTELIKDSLKGYFSSSIIGIRYNFITF